MTAEKSTPCGFSAVLLLSRGVRRRAMGRLAAAPRSHWHGSPARRAQVSLAWVARQPCLALAPWRVRHRLLSGPFSTMVGPCVLNGPFLVAFRACFGPLSTKFGRTCKSDHFEWSAWLWRASACTGTAADGRPASGPRPACSTTLATAAAWPCPRVTAAA